MLASLALRNAEAFEESSRQARIQRGFYRIASVLVEPLSLSADAGRGRAGGGRGARRRVHRRRDAERRRRLALAGGHELPAPLVAALAAGLDGRVRLPARVGGASHPRVALSSRRTTASTAAGARSRSACVSLAAAHPARGRGRGRGGARARLLRGRALARATTTSSSRATSPARHAARSSAAAVRRRSARARALAQQLARTGSALATELDPAAVLDEVVQQAPELLGADACAIRIVDGDELVVTAVAGSRRGGRARRSQRRRRAGSSGTSPSRARRRGRGRRVRRGAARRRRRARGRATARTSASRSSGPRAPSSACSPSTRAGRGAGAPEEIEALLALAANTVRRALERRALPARRAREGAQHRDPREHRGRDRRRRSRRERRALEPSGGADHRRPRRGGARPDAASRSSGGASRRRRAHARARLDRRGGGEIWLSVTEAVMRDPAGQVAGRIYAFRDISADRFVEEMKSEFVSTVSHELRGAAHLDLRLRRDAAARGHPVRRGGAPDFLGYIASESAAADRHRRPAAERRPARHRRPAGQPAPDRRAAARGPRS